MLGDARVPATPSELVHVPPRLDTLDYVFRALALWGGVEAALLLWDLTSRPGIPGIGGQDFALRVFFGLLVTPTLLLLAGFLLWRLPGNVVPRFLVLLSLEGMAGQFAFDFNSLWVSALAVLLFIIPATGIVGPSLGYLMLHFPDGRVYPPWLAGWLKPFAVVKFVGAVLDVMASPNNVRLFSLKQNPLYVPALQPFQPLIASTIGITGVMLPIALIGGMVSLVLRYRVARSAERQQIKWVVWGFGVLFVAMSTAVGLAIAGPNPSPQVNVLLTFAGIAQVIFIGAIVVAMSRHHLYDIDLILSRTLLYLGLSAFVIGVYVLAVAALGSLVQGGGPLLLSLLVTAAIAVLFQPLRERLQRSVNRLVYGERDEPYAVISRLGERLEATFAPDAVLSTIVETVAQALKVPYVGIALKDESGSRIVAETGKPASRLGQCVALPLVYQKETLGELIAAPRTGEDQFSAADLRLLNDVARQAGVAAYSVRLTTDLQRLTVDLQRSRERLVTAREEERRRLRRDLHDGLGPTLAALALTASTARDLIATDPAAAVTLASEVQTEIRGAVAEIRRLVYDLRPPTLDDLGLAAAIRESVDQTLGHLPMPGGTYPVAIHVDAPEPLPPLPAAVEVAAFRIAQEALTNVVRHAHARTCSIRLAIETAPPRSELVLEICDDGDGLPPEYRAGVGLRSMRERAEELGGTCTVEIADGCHTRVVARLPIDKE